MTPAQRALRTFLQLVASGGLTALTGLLVGGLSAPVAAVVLAAYQVLVTFAQNYLEEKDVIPAVAKG